MAKRCFVDFNIQGNVLANERVLFCCCCCSIHQVTWKTCWGQDKIRGPFWCISELNLLMRYIIFGQTSFRQPILWFYGGTDYAFHLFIVVTIFKVFSCDVVFGRDSKPLPTRQRENVLSNTIKGLVVCNGWILSIFINRPMKYDSYDILPSEVIQINPTE